MTNRFTLFIRATWRLSALVWVIVSAATVFALNPANRRTLAARAHWLQRACRAALRALHVRCSPIGPPPRGTIIAANHLGYLDILVLAAAIQVVFVAKREVAGWPVFGWFARMAGTRFIDREKRTDVARVASELAPAIAADLCIVLFLEGTSTDGRNVQPFKSSLLASAVQSHWPVVPAALSYALPAGFSVEQEICWWGDMTLAPHLCHLATLPCIDAFVAWGRPITDVTDRKSLAVSLHARVVALLRALVGCVAPVRNSPPAAVALADASS